MLSVGIGECYRSQAGAMVERARGATKMPPRDPNWLPTDSWKHAAPKNVRVEPSYELEFGDLFKLGRVTRTLMLVDSMDTHLCSVLVALYGDRGARWEKLEDGAITAVFPMTDTGGKLLSELRKRNQSVCDVRDDELLNHDIKDQRAAPNDIRRRRHRMMRNEADELKARAHRVWHDAVAKIDDRRTGLRR